MHGDRNIHEGEGEGERERERYLSCSYERQRPCYRRSVPIQYSICSITEPHRIFTTLLISKFNNDEHQRGLRRDDLCNDARGGWNAKRKYLADELDVMAGRYEDDRELIGRDLLREKVQQGAALLVRSTRVELHLEVLRFEIQRMAIECNQ